jgi:selenocysteine-specific elongation factor
MHVIGTAGHVDHGKSTLVLALTGIDPDRLAEEKARQMTIDLGFAWLNLDGQEVGVVDVPGHRDFIENMLAGVGGIDLALFVIAADEGVMPQTREHLAILDLLQVERGVVALTKIDLVSDPDWLELVELEISDVLAGTVLAGAPIVPVSARTGQGLSALRETLLQALRECPPAVDLGRPRLPVDRVFTLPGFGTIVTGTLAGGRLRVGDDVELQPGGLKGRIRGLQTHKTKRDVALPGSRVAVNLTGIDHTEVARGQVVAAPGTLRSSQLIDVTYRHLPDSDSPLEHNEAVKLFVGSAEVSTHARVIGRDNIPPGENGWLQLALAAPVAVDRGDRFILRRPSPGSTLGGGRVLDPLPGRRHRRFREDVLGRFNALEKGSPEELLLETLNRLGPSPAVTLLEKAGLNSQEGRQALDGLVTGGQVLALGKLVASPGALQALQERAVALVAAYHQDFPLRAGLDREELRSRLQVTGAVFAPLLAQLQDEGRLVEQGTLLRLPAHTITFSAEQQAGIDQLRNFLAAKGVNSPSVKECKALVGESVYFALVDLGELRPLSEEVVYAAAEYDRLLGIIRGHLQAHGTINAATVRDLLGTSRKYAIALLEHLDELRVTRRVGDERVLNSPGVA